LIRAALTLDDEALKLLDFKLVQARDQIATELKRRRAPRTQAGAPRTFRP
jgi:hypothetical protein